MSLHVHTASPRLPISDASGGSSAGSKLFQTVVTLSPWLLTIDQDDVDYFHSLGASPKRSTTFRGAGIPLLLSHSKVKHSLRP